MDVLRDKQWQEYNYTSRYTPFPFYYNEVDSKYIYGITKQLGDDTEYVMHTLVDSDTLDSLALKYYGRPDLYWVISDFNQINDPYINLKEKMDTIMVPSISNIYYSPGR
jgi:hypothetical protein